MGECIICFKIFIWFIILCIAENNIFTKPTKWWWLIMIVNLGISFIMALPIKEKKE